MYGTNPVTETHYGLKKPPKPYSPGTREQLVAKKKAYKKQKRKEVFSLSKQKIKGAFTKSRVFGGNKLVNLRPQ
jgi:hypothetical protein